MYKKIKKVIYNAIVPMIKIWKKIQWNNYLKNAEKIKLIVGAGPTNYNDWFSTDISTLDVTKEADFKKYFTKKTINKILAEHVLEHLTDSDLEKMCINFYKYSAEDINIRIAVPDGFHSSKEYVNLVRPGGIGEGAFDHKNLFTYKSLAALFEKHGFSSTPIEYWDEDHQFHSVYKNDDKGYIMRSFVNDDRNRDGKPNYTSLIMDFHKK